MIQPIGFHLSLSGEWRITSVSANIGDYLPATAEQSLGQPMDFVMCEDAIHDIRNRMALLRGDDAVEHLLHISLVQGGEPFDLTIVRQGDGFGIDAEPCDGHAFGDTTGIVEGMLARVEAAADAASICNEAARQMRALTGFDRVLVYGNSILLGQSARGGLPPSDQSPASPEPDDLAVVDCAANTVAILGLGKQGGHRSTLRLPTEAETARLAANGARAALIVPMVRDGQTWGQVVCFHPTPRHVGVERRSSLRLFARIIALRIEIAELRSGRGS